MARLYRSMADESECYYRFNKGKFMNNKERYSTILAEVLMIDCEKVEEASSENLPAWDSVGKIGLVTALEDEFSIEIEVEEILSFNSYAAGVEILKNHGINM